MAQPASSASGTADAQSSALRRSGEEMRCGMEDASGVGFKQKCQKGQCPIGVVQMYFEKNHT
jgi:hypothetical protein